MLDTDAEKLMKKSSVEREVAEIVCQLPEKYERRHVALNLLAEVFDYPHELKVKTPTQMFEVTSIEDMGEDFWIELKPL